ncbi:acyl--CoA ligase [Thermoplasmatales archaeon AK]|nr:acyl--CoA ligase [Thermoplasmatales archaeon AK]
MAESVPRDIISLFGDQRRRFQSRPVIIFQGRHLTYHNAEVYSSSLAYALKSTLGLSGGENVLVALPMSPQLIISLLAIIKAGAVPAFIDPQSTSQEIRAYTNLEKFRGIILSLENGTEIGTDHNISFVIQVKIRDFLPFESFAYHAIKRPFLDSKVPKEIEVLDFSQAIYDAHEFQATLENPETLRALFPGVDASGSFRFMSIGFSTLLRRAASLKERLPTKALAPRIATNIEPWCPEGLIISFLLPLLMGGSAVTAYDRSTSYLMRLADIFQSEILALTPADLISAFVKGGKKLPRNVKTVLTDTARSSRALRTYFANKFPQKLAEYFGVLELGGITHISAGYGEDGLPLFQQLEGIENEIRDRASGEKINPGNPGKIYVTDSSVSGIQTTAETGSIGYIDEKGLLRIQSCVTPRIFPDGHTAFPQEVELVVSSLPYVKEVACVERQEDDCTDSIFLFVVPKPGKQWNEAEFRGNLVRYLPRRLIPDKIIRRDDLPKTLNGRILRNVLQEEVGK